jgi:hypothetical protein
MILHAILLLSAVCASTQDSVTGPPPIRSEQPLGDEPSADLGVAPIEPLGDNRYRIGTLMLDQRKREIRFPGAFVQREVPLEYLICAPGGKLYESLLRADVNPYNLQLALLLLGLEPRNNLEIQGDAVQATGDPVTILVSWDSETGEVTRRAETLLWQPANERSMEETSWVFSGSEIIDGVFRALVDRSLVAVYNDPSAIINNPLPTGADDTSYVPNRDLVPPIGTQVEIILKAAPPEESR